VALSPSGAPEYAEGLGELRFAKQPAHSLLGTQPMSRQSTFTGAALLRSRSGVIREDLLDCVELTNALDRFFGDG
jgi:hypothetical protein